LSWQIEQSIPNSIVLFYGDCVKMCADFALNFGDKRIGCGVMITHHFTLPFSPGNFFSQEQNFLNTV
jgi:hypothetical protein